MTCPQLVSNYITPTIKWYQTDLTIVIRVQLIDVIDYYLRVEDDRLIFSTKINGKGYYLILHLFGSVIAEKTIHKNVGREIKIYLTKGLKWYPWLRLVLAKEKNLFILYDPDHICEAERNKRNVEIKVQRFTEYKRQNQIQYILPVEPSSDEEESEDEDQIDFVRFA